MAGMSAFSDKFTLALKALSLSRGRLAADLGVDKSVVGRWATGVMTPSAHNMSRLTALIAGQVPTSPCWTGIGASPISPR